MSLSRLGLSVLVAGLLAGACGFQLQGTGQLPETMNPVYIQTADEYTVFYRVLRTELEQGGVSTTRDFEKAGAVLKVREDSTGQRLVAVSAQNIPEEYQVFYIVRFEVAKKGEQILPEQRIARAENYLYDATKVLGKSREEEIVRKALATDIARQVRRQLTQLR